MDAKFLRAIGISAAVVGLIVIIIVMVSRTVRRPSVRRLPHAITRSSSEQSRGSLVDFPDLPPAPQRRPVKVLFQDGTSKNGTYVPGQTLRQLKDKVCG